MLKNQWHTVRSLINVFAILTKFILYTVQYVVSCRDHWGSCPRVFWQQREYVDPGANGKRREDGEKGTCGLSGPVQQDQLRAVRVEFSWGQFNALTNKIQLKGLCCSLSRLCVSGFIQEVLFTRMREKCQSGVKKQGWDLIRLAVLSEKGELPIHVMML